MLQPHGTKMVVATETITNAVLSIIELYHLKASPFNSSIVSQCWETFFPLIQKAIEVNELVSFILPAFPFKSPNKVDKVLSVLPDKCEEVALLHLQGFCNNIR